MMFELFFIPHPGMRSFAEPFAWILFWYGICFAIFCYLIFQIYIALKKLNGQKRILITMIYITAILAIGASAYLLSFDYFIWWLIHSIILFAYAISPLKNSTEEMYLFKIRIPIIVVCALNVIWMICCICLSSHSGYWYFISSPSIGGISGYRLNEVWYIINIAIVLICKAFAQYAKRKRENI